MLSQKFVFYFTEIVSMKTILPLFLLILIVVFIGMGATILAVVQGRPSERSFSTKVRDDLSTTMPGVVLLGLVFLLGVYIPEPVESLVRDAAEFIEVTP